MHLATKDDLPFIESVINHPTVRRFVWSGDDHLDCSEAIESMWTLVVPGAGVMMAEALGDGNYLGLTAFLPEARGLKASVAMRKAIRKIFIETDCSRLFGSVDPSNRTAVRNLIGVGFKGIRASGNRIVSQIDYIDLLDEKMFMDTVRAGWAGKALYWWEIKAKIENIAPIVPLNTECTKFLIGDKVVDVTEVSNG